MYSVAVVVNSAALEEPTYQILTQYYAKNLSNSQLLKIAKDIVKLKSVLRLEVYFVSPLSQQEQLPTRINQKEVTSLEFCTKT